MYSTINTLDTIETFIAETMYNLSLPNLMCYSASYLHPHNCYARCTVQESSEHRTVLYVGLNSCLCRR